MTTAATRTNGGTGKPSTAVTVASNNLRGKILEHLYLVD
jgi:hypothetical protein